MPRYQVTAPDGRQVVIEGDSQPTDADLEELFGGLPEAKSAGASGVDENTYFRRVGAMPKLRYEKGDAIGTKYENGDEYVGDDPRIGTPMIRRPMNEALATTARFAGPALGAASPIPGGAAIGAVGGEAIARELEGRPQTLGTLAPAITAAIPGAGSFAGSALRFAGGNTLARNIETMADEGRTATLGENALAMAMGLGGAGLEKALRSNGIGTETFRGNNTLTNTERDSLAAGMQRGMKLNPAEVNDTFANRIKSGVAGADALKSEIRASNRTAATNATKEQLGIPAAEDITDATIKRRIADVSQPQNEIRALGPDFDQALTDVQRAREQASIAWQAHRADYRRVPITEVKAAQQAADNAEAQLELMVQQVDPTLAGRYVQGRKLAAEAFTAKDALNPASGNIDVTELGDRVLQRQPISGPMADVGRFAATETGSRYVGLSPNPAGSTTLRTTGAMASGAAALPDVGKAAAQGGVWLLNDPMRRYLAGDSKVLNAVFGNPQKAALQDLLGREMLNRRMQEILKAVNTTDYQLAGAMGDNR